MDDAKQSQEQDQDPAWMLCEDILTRIKDELILEAIDLLHVQIKEGSVSIDGYVVTLPDKSQEIARDIFVINNLLSEQNQIRETYKKYINDNQGAATGETVEKSEKMKRFLLFLDELSILMSYSEVFGVWITDAWQYAKLNDVSQIIANTMSNSEDRADALRFVLSSKGFAKEEIFTTGERDALSDAMRYSATRQ
jgi:hypothetical protein